LKTLLIVLIVGAVIGLSGFGVLANDVVLDVQKLGVFPSIDTFLVGGFSCSCDGAECMYLDSSDPGATPDDPFWNPHAKMICGWESHLLGYDLPPPANSGEGCSVDFWSTYNGIGSNEDKWPQGYEPEYKYNDMFSTTYYLHDAGGFFVPEVTTVEGDYDDDDDDGDGRGDDDDDGDGRGDDDGDGRGDDDDDGDGRGDDDDDGDGRGDDEGYSGVEGDYDFDHPYGPTLQEALEIQGVGYDSLIPESVAALLNAASNNNDVNYKYDVSKVIEFTQKAINGGHYDKEVAEFVEYIKYPTGSPLCPAP